MKNIYKREILWITSDKQKADHIASWISKASRIIRCTVRKQIRKDGIQFVITLKYKITIRAKTLINIGYQLSTYTEGRLMMMQPRTKHEGTITPEEISESFSLSNLNELPFN